MVGGKSQEEAEEAEEVEEAEELIEQREREEKGNIGVLLLQPAPVQSVAMFSGNEVHWFNTSPPPTLYSPGWHPEHCEAPKGKKVPALHWRSAKNPEKKGDQQEEQEEEQEQEQEEEQEEEQEQEQEEEQEQEQEEQEGGTYCKGGCRHLVAKQNLKQG